MWCDQKELLCLATLVQNDTSPAGGAADAAYAFGNTKHVQHNILEGIAALYAIAKTSRIVLLKLAAGYPYHEVLEADRYAGFAVWRDYLILHHKIHPKVIEPIMSPYPQKGEVFPRSHTGSEAEEFVRRAKEKAWKSVYVVSHPIHQLRVFALTVTMAKSIYPDLKIYSWPGRQVKRWNEPGPRGHNVTTDSSQFDFLGGELDRLNKIYGNRWDPLPASEIIEYVRRRDS